MNKFQISLVLIAQPLDRTSMSVPKCTSSLYLSRFATYGKETSRSTKTIFCHCSNNRSSFLQRQTKPSWTAFKSQCAVWEIWGNYFCCSFDITIPPFKPDNISMTLFAQIMYCWYWLKIPILVPISWLVIYNSKYIFKLYMIGQT